MNLSRFRTRPENAQQPHAHLDALNSLMCEPVSDYGAVRASISSPDTWVYLAFSPISSRFYLRFLFEGHGKCPSNSFRS